VEESSGRTYNQIYEEDFLGFSYGFRPRRSQHQALDALSYALVKRKVNYVLDADIQGFFDNLDKAWMIKFIEHHRLKLTTMASSTACAPSLAPCRFAASHPR
jgi:hypothetical protein